MILFFDFLSILSTNILLFILMWVFCFFYARVSWVDFFWSASIGAWSVMHLYESIFTNSNPVFRALALITFLWSKRLSAHLYYRIKSSAHEDRRYEEVKKRSPKSWGRKSFIIFFINALLVSLLVLPQRILSLDQEAILNITRLLPALLCLGAILGEHIADSQLKKHLQNVPGTTCQSGLWRYSRHPNYFFEWLFWVGCFLFVLPSPYGIWALTAPVLMFVFLNYFTGVKISEKNAEARRKDFAEYKRKTSAFFLCPVKKDKSPA